MTKRKKIGAIAMVGLMSIGLAACGKEKEAEQKTEPVVVAVTEGNEYSLDHINSCDLTYGAVSLRVRDGEGVLKNVLADKDLKVFCEWPSNLNVWDEYEGKFVIGDTNQDENPGFRVIDSEGKELFVCTQKVKNVSFDHCGNLAYIENKSDLVAHFLDQNFNEEGKMNISDEDVDRMKYIYRLQDGIYISSGLEFPNNSGYGCFLDVKNDIMIPLDGSYNGEDISVSVKGTFIDSQKIIFQMYINSPKTYERYHAYVELGEVDFTDIKTSDDFYTALTDKAVKIDAPEDADVYVVIANHKVTPIVVKSGELVSIEGFKVPKIDYRGEIAISDDGTQCAVGRYDSDSNNMLVSVFNNEGEYLYELAQSPASDFDVVHSGYVFFCYGDSFTKEVLNPKGEYVLFDDGFDMSDFPSDITVYTGSGSSISQGYIFADLSEIYKTDGTKIETLTS